MSNYTPGPWMVVTKPEQDHRVFFIHHDDGINWIGPLEIAIIYSGGNDNAKEDAHLIAAAPSLLEALKEIAKDQYGSSGALARAAIMEVEGKP